MTSSGHLLSTHGYSGRRGDRARPIEWSLPLTVKRCDTGQKMVQRRPEATTEWSSFGGRPVRDEIILRAASAKASRQLSASGNRSLGIRPKASDATTTVTQIRKQPSHSITSAMTHEPSTVDTGECSLVIKPAIVARLKPSEISDGRQRCRHVQRNTRSCKMILNEHDDRSDGGATKNEGNSIQYGGENSNRNMTREGTSPARTIDIFLPPIDVDDVESNG